jgi:hypothetical protein
MVGSLKSEGIANPGRKYVMLGVVLQLLDEFGGCSLAVFEFVYSSAGGGGDKIAEVWEGRLGQHSRTDAFLTWGKLRGA